MQRSGQGEWTITVDTDPGEYGYKFVVDEEWILDPENPEQRIVEGITNSRVDVAVAGRQDVLPETRAAKPDDATSPTGSPSADKPDAASFPDSAPAAPESGAAQGSGPFAPGMAAEEIHTFSLPMKHAIPFLFGGGGYDPARHAESMRLAIAVPKAFDPASAQGKVAIISASVDGDASNITALRQYYRTTTRNGWVCLAVDVDGDAAKVKSWTPLDLRYLLVFNALTEMRNAWPASTDWQMVALGFAGGGGDSNYIAARLSTDGFRVTGIFNGCSGYSNSHYAGKLAPAPAQDTTTKYFLSSGSSDPVATPQVVAKAEAWAKSKFSHFRHETFDGGHRLWLPHVQQALVWFSDDR